MAITSTTTPSSTPSSTPSTTPEALETWGDDALARAVAVADLPALLVALAQVTGDDVYLDPRLRPRAEVPAVGGIDQGGYDAGQKQLARELCLRGLQVFRDSGFATAPEPDTARLRTLLAFSAPGASEEYLPLLAHELDVPRDSGAPGWVLDEVAPGRELRVAVIGAGLSGLVAAHRAQQAGLDVVVFDKNPAAGGTWFENTYPGCRLDTHNYAYAYSFAQKPDWPSFFSTADSIRDYLADFAVDEGIEELVRYSTRVTSLAWDASTSTWLVCSTGPEGERRETFHAVISAVGQLNVPQVPAFPGLDTFGGEAFHTAQWRHDVDLTGKRVAVVGTGASAFQVVPAIAGEVGELSVFQRNAPWTLPTPRYMDRIEEAQLDLFRSVPSYAAWFRFYQFWTSVEGRRRFAEADPAWTGGPETVSAANAELREALLGFHRERFANRPDLAAKTTPTYPPGAKRMLRDNGVWAAALGQGNVHLVTAGISEITPAGIRTTDGVEHEVDVIVWATGFNASNFLESLQVSGVDGVDLHRYWDGDARAYLGITVPHFPNLFCIYGPNTNLVVNGSTVLFSELSAEYILRALHGLLERGEAALEVREDVYEAYNERVDEANRLMAWGAAEVSSWYKNSRGRVSQVWPFPILDYWTSTLEVDLDAYKREPLPEAPR
jgi:4-hydroxyacetophenone monooxygenase